MIEIKLNYKPIATPIKYNAYFKLVLLLAIVNYCGRSRKASVLIIHLLFWALRNEKNYCVIKAFARQERRTLVPWSFENGVEKVLTLAFVEGFCKKTIVSSRLDIIITDLGKSKLAEIEELGGFTADIDKIKAIGPLMLSKVETANKNWELI